MIKQKPNINKLSQQELQIPRDKQNRTLTTSVEFYNVHIRKEGEKVLTQEEYNLHLKRIKRLQEMRNRTEPITLVNRKAEYPLKPDEAFKPEDQSVEKK